MKLKYLTTAVLMALLCLAATPVFAQDQINLGDGLFNAHFNGSGSPIITTVIPAIYFSGGNYYLANGSASASGHLAGSGSYAIYTPSPSPFFLTRNADDSFTITQTSPIFFLYTSPQGTLTGNLYFSTISKTQNRSARTFCDRPACVFRPLRSGRPPPTSGVYRSPSL